jgi:hypothetical protein
MAKSIANYSYIPIRVSIKWLITIRDYDINWYKLTNARGRRAVNIANIELPESAQRAQVCRGRNTRVIAVKIDSDNMPEFKQKALDSDMSLGEYVKLRLIRNAYELLKNRTNLFYTIKWRFDIDNPPI